MRIDEIRQSIISHRDTQQVTDTILSDPGYYNSLLVEDELYIKYKLVRTRTTLIGLAALHDNDEVMGALLEAQVPADGLDMLLLQRSLREEHNYQSLDEKVYCHVVGGFGIFQSANENYWSTNTCVFDREERLMLRMPWSTPILLALLAESEGCLSLLLKYAALCDFRHPFFAGALELCENESMLLQLSKVDKLHLKETIADCLTAFNEPLAKMLFQLGKKPKPSIITDILMRMEGFTDICFGGFQYEMNKDSLMWKQYFEQRANACLNFYLEQGYGGEDPVQDN